MARDHLPIGAGFGMYGSHLSRAEYSPIYAQYGLDRVPLLGPDQPYAVTDTYWPMVLGETGLIGLLAALTFFATVLVGVWHAASSFVHPRRGLSGWRCSWSSWRAWSGRSPRRSTRRHRSRTSCSARRGVHGAAADDRGGWPPTGGRGLRLAAEVALEATHHLGGLVAGRARLGGRTRERAELAVARVAEPGTIYPRSLRCESSAPTWMSTSGWAEVSVATPSGAAISDTCLMRAAPRP